MTQKQRRINQVFLIVAVIAFAILLFTQQETLKETWAVLKTVDPLLVALLPTIQTVNYFLIGTYYRLMFKSFGTKITIARSWGVVAALNFVNQILPSGGLSGISYLAYGFRSRLAIGKTTLIQLGRYVFAFTSYALLGPVALLMIINDGQFDTVLTVGEKIQNNWGALATVIAFFVLVAALMVAIVRKDVGDVLGAQAAKFINRFRPKDKPWEFTFIKNLYKELHEGIDFFKERGGKAVLPGLSMLASALCEVSIVIVAFYAVGADISPAIIFFSFVAANVAGVISVIPGDVGVHEGVMIAMTSTFGVPIPEALSAILLYRVFNKVIFLPVGFYFYSQILKPARAKIEKQNA